MGMLAISFQEFHTTPAELPVGRNMTRKKYVIF